MVDLIHRLSKFNQLMLSLIFLLSISNFFSCGNQQKKLQKMADSTPLITYKKERTRGMKKPLFTIEVLESKAVKYTGIANVPVIGEKIITIDRTVYHDILAQFQAANFTNFKTIYKGKLRDLPLTTITFNAHSVTYQEEVCPKQLGKLAKLIENLVAEE